jgi:ribosomal protein S18 acetylase RimI-like enzyme
MSAIIRPIKADDVEAVRRQMFAHLSPAALAEYLASHPVESARTEKILLGYEGICLVAEQAGKIIGFIMGVIAPKVAPEIRYAVIENLRVEPEHRHQGVGSQLLEQFRRLVISRGATRLTVDVSPNNESAIRFYRRFELVPATLTLESDLY